MIYQEIRQLRPLIPVTRTWHVKIFGHWFTYWRKTYLA